jgi:hypothetical protein
MVLGYLVDDIVLSLLELRVVSKFIPKYFSIFVKLNPVLLLVIASDNVD